MQNSFYASGFLYSLKTGQILLLQSNSEDSPLWSTFGGEGLEEEESSVAFQRIINNLLNLNLKLKDIYPVYDYFQATRNKINFVFYAQVKSTKKFNNPEDISFSWSTFDEARKFQFTTQTKQDIVVGERVINAKLRDLAYRESEE